MKTVLLLTESPETPRWLTQALGSGHTVVPLAPPAREHLAALFETWRGLADAVLLDAASMQEAARWSIEALAQAQWPDATAVLVRVSPMQRSLFPMNSRWLVLGDDDSMEQAQEAITRFFALSEAQAKLKELEAQLAQPVPAGRDRQPAQRPDSGQTHRYQVALQKVLQTVGGQSNQADLPVEFTRLVRELLGVGRVALFTRPLHSEFLSAETIPTAALLAVVASDGVRREIVDHLRLSLESGIGGFLARENKILWRNGGPSVDPKVEREFQLLGTEVAVPMFDNDQLLGVLTLNGRVTGEALTNEELELVYHLLGHLARTLRSLALQQKVTAQQRFTTEVLANVQTGLVIVDGAGLVANLNPRARELLELGDRPLLGQPLRELPGRFADVLFDVLQTGKHLRHHEIVLPRHHRPLGLNVSRLQADGSAVVVALIEDLTQLKREQFQAREAVNREFFTRVAYRLSHELKNSLVSIKIFGQLLPERHAEKDFREQFSNVVVNEVNRVDVLVNNLTFFAQPLGLVYEEVTLTDLIDSCVQNLTQELERKKLARLVNMGDKIAADAPELPVITVKRNYAHRAPVLEADRLRLLQALEHVLRNAAQAMPSGGRLLIGTADATADDFADGQLPEGGAVRIEVQDTGEGIALEALPKVTEPFVTTRNVGVGLGLTIVKKIVDRHSGRLLMDSLLGRGTKVTLVLPTAMQSHPEDKLLAQLARAGEKASERGESDATERNRLALLLENHRRRRAQPTDLNQ